jgi:hypothetical protein
MKTKKLKELSVFLLAIILIATGLNSCTKDGSATTTNNSFVMVTNAASTSTAQDFYLDSTKVTTAPLAYGASTSSFLQTVNGSHLARFRDAGTTNVNVSFNIILDVQESYNVFYVDGDQYVTIYNDRSIPMANNVRVRFINLSTALSSTNVDFITTGGTTLGSNLPFKTPSIYSDVDPSTGFAVYRKGLATPVVSIPASLQPGRVYTIFIAGTNEASIDYHFVTEH